MEKLETLVDILTDHIEDLEARNLPSTPQMVEGEDAGKDIKPPFER